MTVLRACRNFADKSRMTDLGPLSQLLQAQDWAGAEALLRRAASDKGAPAAVFYNLGKVLEAGGRPERSAPWFRRAVAADPAYAIAWFELGRRAIAGHDLAEAERAFTRAAALLPGDADAWRNLGRVRLRLGLWERARQAWMRFDDAEARAALYRIAAELGEASGATRAELLSDPSRRPEAIRALTRVARGAVPLRLPKV